LRLRESSRDISRPSNVHGIEGSAARPSGDGVGAL
jgi:hypothetical protein